jgi:hypothetical protein
MVESRYCQRRASSALRGETEMMGADDAFDILAALEYRPWLGADNSAARFGTKLSTAREEDPFMVMGVALIIVGGLIAFSGYIAGLTIEPADEMQQIALELHHLHGALGILLAGLGGALLAVARNKCPVAARLGDAPEEVRRERTP